MGLGLPAAPTKKPGSRATPWLVQYTDSPILQDVDSGLGGATLVVPNKKKRKLGQWVSLSGTKEVVNWWFQ